jgi:hypothetical protein
MSDQGTFTPPTTQSDVTTVPVPIDGPAAYQHGQTWTVDANGFFLGSSVAVGDIITAIHYLEPLTLHERISMDFMVGMPGGFPLSLDCHQLVIRLDLREPENPEWANVGRWDESLWDNIDPPSNAFWASTDVGSWVNISDRCRGIKLKRGRSTSWNDIFSANVQIEVDNTDGFFSAFSTTGDVKFRLNTGFYVGAFWRGVEYPLFIGRLKDYDEDDHPYETGAVFTGYDALADLVFEVASEYNAGAAYDRADVRINKILDEALIPGVRNIAPGNATMTNYKTQRNFLDEIRVTAMSDGGLFFVDNDGTLIYLNRDRVNGRVRDYGFVPYFSDSCEDEKLPYAAIQMVWNDHEFGNLITISNVSQGQESPNSVMSYDQASIDKYGTVAWRPSQLVICNVEHMQELANWEMLRRREGFYRINRFEVYPAHDDRIWTAMLQMRIGDPLFVERTPPGSLQKVISPCICDGVEIEGTPELWKFIVYVSPAVNILGRRYGDYEYGYGTYGLPV